MRWQFPRWTREPVTVASRAFQALLLSPLRVRPGSGHGPSPRRYQARSQAGATQYSVSSWRRGQARAWEGHLLRLSPGPGIELLTPGSTGVSSAQ